jgi:GTP-binding protein
VAKEEDAPEGLHLDVEPPTEEAIEAARLVFAAPCRFFFAAQRLDQLPPPSGTEIAFAGRSNVGKSSLINALTGQNTLARASNTPGRTRQLNFFDLGGRLTLVDMPGYGYAQAEKKVKEDWQGLMFDYLRGRPNLRRVMDLLDKAAVTFQIVVTKADGLKPPGLARKLAAVSALARAHAAGFPEVLVTSARSSLGIPEARAAFAALAAG